MIYSILTAWRWEKNNQNLGLDKKSYPLGWDFFVYTAKQG